jgi:isocitrate lyase
MFDLAQAYSESGMTAFAALQAEELQRAAGAGYRAVKHQAFVGVGYFDQVAQTISSGTASTTAFHGSTEEEQFESPRALAG